MKWKGLEQIKMANTAAKHVYLSAVLCARFNNYSARRRLITAIFAEKNRLQCEGRLTRCTLSVRGRPLLNESPALALYRVPASHYLFIKRRLKFHSDWLTFASAAMAPLKSLAKSFLPLPLLLCRHRRFRRAARSPRLIFASPRGPSIVKIVGAAWNRPR